MSNINGSSILKVIDSDSWGKFCKKYLEDCKKYGIEICKSFQNLIPKHLLITPEIVPAISFLNFNNNIKSEANEHLALPSKENVFKKSN